MTDLKTFIQATLVQIVEGVATARDDIEKLGGAVNPEGLEHDGTPGLRNRHDYSIAQVVEVEVAVTTTTGTKTEGTLGVKVAVLGAGTKGHTEKSSSLVNRIKFSVPIQLPHGTTESIQRGKEIPSVVTVPPRRDMRRGRMFDPGGV